MPWLGIAVAVAALAAISLVLMRAMRKTQHNESWGVGELSQRFVQPLPYNPGGLPPVKIVSEPAEGAAPPAETE